MEGTDAKQAIVKTKLQSPDTTILVYRYLEENTESLLGTLRTFILSLGVVRDSSETVQAVAVELLNEVVVEALAHSDRYDPKRQLGAWLWGIALNITKRRKAERVQSYGRESTFSTLQHNHDASNDDAFFDQFASLMVVGPEQDVEAKEQFEILLSLTSEDDQQVLRLAILHDLDNVQMAQALAIKPDAVRQRFHRALKRLRAILEEQRGESNV